MPTPDWLRAAMKIFASVYLRVPVGTDEYGNTTYGEQQVDTWCFIQPSGEQEIQDGRADVGTYTVHFGHEMFGVIDAFAKMEVAGTFFEMVGPPAVYPDLDNASIHHLEITVSRSTA